VPHGLRRDSADHAQGNKFLTKQGQGPVAAALGRITASQLDQLLLNVAFDLDLVRSRRLRSVVEGRREPFGDQAFAHSFDRPQARAQSGDDVLIAMPEVLGSIGEQQDAGMGEFARRRLADSNRVFQLVSLLRRQGNSKFLHGGSPVLEGAPCALILKKQDLDSPVNRRLTGY
jgi:hypothetical protein